VECPGEGDEEEGEGHVEEAPKGHEAGQVRGGRGVRVLQPGDLDVLPQLVHLLTHDPKHPLSGNPSSTIDDADILAAHSV
jgi:hypothetical protein